MVIVMTKKKGRVASSLCWCAHSKLECSGRSFKAGPAVVRAVRPANESVLVCAGCVPIFYGSKSQRFGCIWLFENTYTLPPFCMKTTPVSQVRVERSEAKPLACSVVESVKEVDLVGCKMERQEGKERKTCVSKLNCLSGRSK
jgi:hypothetical protein